MQTLSNIARRLCWLALAAFMLQTTLVRAEMLPPQSALEPPVQSQADQDRAKVQQFLERSTVKDKLQAMGVDALNAHDRVAAMSDAEVHALAGRIDALPAGGALSQNDWILILLVAILVLVAL